MLSRIGKEAVIAMLAPGDFFGESTFSDRFISHMLTRNICIELGLIEYNGGLKINSSLLSIVVHD